MFTFGIFTTHFPYIAVVAFYAYFLIFGVNKAATGELQLSDSSFKTEIQESRTYDNLNDDSNFYYQTDFDFSLYTNLEKSIFKRKIKHRSTIFSACIQTGFNSIHFSRPPPSFI